MTAGYAIPDGLGPVLAGTAGVGALAGAVGTLMVARREALQGDAVSHAALPGVALAALLGLVGPLPALAGAALTGLLALGAVRLVTARGVTRPDAALAGALATFFGLGLALLAVAQSRAEVGAAARAQRYLFGQEAATLRGADLLAPALVAAPAVLLLLALWKELALTSFDGDYAMSLGLPRRRLDAVMSILVVSTVVAGIQTVGVILISALLVAPAVAARQWCDRLAGAAIAAATLGAASGAGGALLADALSRPRAPVPTGPAVVLLATALAIGSVALRSLKRGLDRRPAGGSA